MTDTKNKVEALLFASGKGITVEDIADHCEEKSAAVKKALQKLSEEFKERDGSLAVEERDGKWKMSVVGKYTEYVKKIVSETELPGPVLKTLAVIAYKSPVLQSDIIHMRGQGAYDHIKQLVKGKFITKDEEGRSYILKITDKFFNYFDVEGDAEIREIFQSLKEKEEQAREQIEKDLSEQQKLGELEVVDSQEREHEHEGIFDETQMAQTRSQSPEEKEEQEQFLKDMDSKIDQIATRLDGHTLPERTRPEEEQEEDSQGEKKHAEDDDSAEDSTAPQEEETKEENYL